MYLICLFLLFHFISVVCPQKSSQESPENGFLKREYGLSKPYSVNGMTMPFWDFIDNAIITNNYVRLTSNHQGQRGSIWSKVPCYLRDWELQVNFKVHGSGRTLAADGLAIWYTHGKMTTGPVFGSQDEFRGLGVFLDTYKNGDQSETFPLITAMVGNGTEKYDHLSDGQLHAIGSCLGAFRNKDYETLVSIRYVKKRLMVSLDVDGLGLWRTCIDVSGVTLPTGYYFGASAATGDLADNHDVIGIKLYQLDVERSESELEEDWSTAKPGVSFFKPPIDNRDDGGRGGYRNSSLSRGKIILLSICTVFGIGICIVVGFLVFKKRQEENRKRFY